MTESTVWPGDPGWGLSAAREVFDPLPPVLDRRDTAGGPRLVSLPRGTDPPAEPAHRWGPLVAEVVLPAFRDGSLGLRYQNGWVYPVPAGVIAAALAPVLAGRPFVITAVPLTGGPSQGAVRRTLLAATVEEVREMVARLTGGDPARADPDLALVVPDPGVGAIASGRERERELARQLVRLLRRGLLAQPGAADAMEQGIRAVGDAVAGVYWALMGDGDLPPGWVAEQFRGGLWVRPQADVAADRALVNGLTGSPAAGLLVVGTARRPTTAEAGQVPLIEQALSRIAPADMSGVTVVRWEAVSIPGSWEDQHGREMIRQARAARIPGRFVVGLRVDPGGELAAYGEDGRGFRAGANGLRRAHLEALGWRRGQVIVVVTRHRGDGADQDWEALTEGLAGLARAAGVSVFFPGRGSRADRPYREGEPLVLVGGDERRWLRADPPRGPREPARPAFVQDPDGQLWLREPGTGFVFLPLGAGVALRAGVASPTDEMMRARVRAYQRPRGDDDLGVFVIDVPLSMDGQLGLVRDEAGASGRPRAPSRQ